MLQLDKIIKLRNHNGKMIGQCPACAETGNDKTGNHLFINSDGKFGCVLYQGSDGDEHRKRIFEMIGIPDEKPTSEKPKWTPQSCAPENAPAPTLTHWKHGKPSNHWTYRTNDGRIACIVARFDLGNGKKETPPMSWCTDQHGNSSWQWRAMPDPRTIYGLPFTSDKIIIAEGEKCAEAIRSAGYEATTWLGGSGAAARADWEPLKGKHVIIWPDNDDPGFKVAKIIKSLLRDIAKSVTILSIPTDKPTGWDAADTDEHEIRSIIDQPEPDDTTEPTHEPENRLLGLPFAVLGMDDGVMVYMPDNGQHIIKLTASAHTKLNLLQLAPIQSWEMTFPSKNGCDWDAACNAMIQMSQSTPRFDPISVRGRGCWIDGDDIIYHAGNMLAVNGDPTRIPDYRSQTGKIYEAGLKIQIDTAHPATNKEAAQLLKLCDSLSFEKPLSGKLLAGWLTLAPICGSMPWRPHIWITGVSGTGKSWIMENIISQVVGSSALFVQGNTSEAGIRGSLKSDALPVMFDEAESENNRSSTRMESVMELARQSSSEGGGGIVKGTANGGSNTYMIRSVFCFSSIGVAATKKADISRISVLSLRKLDSPESFDAIIKIWRNTVSDKAYCSKLRSRSVKNAITIRKNAEVFTDAAVEFLGDKRTADQYGTLLAAAYSLTSTRPITPKKAKEWLEMQDWDDYKADSEDNDESQCLSYLLSSIIKVERWDNSALNLSVNEAIEHARSNDPDHKDALLRVGIKVSGDEITVANSHRGLSQIFKDSPWADGKWKSQLLRIPESYATSGSVRFGEYLRSRGVIVKL